MARSTLRLLTVVLLGATLSLLNAAMFGAAVLADVNPDGSFGYTIPIEVPPGPHGVQPNLALVYNSNSPNGMLGVGWSLSGLPVITRMNYGRGINYDGLDTFVGPAGRLVKLSDGTYHSEQESWGRYQPSGTCGDGPCSWLLTDKDGGTWTFGATTDSRILAIGRNGSARVWTLNQYADRFGNAYSVNYTNESVGSLTTGAYYPASITYGNSTVLFSSYDTSRPDLEESHRQSAEELIRKRLTGIQIAQGPITQRTYAITYGISNTSGRSRIQGVTVAGPGEPEASLVNPVQWADGSALFESSVLSNFSSGISSDLSGAPIDIARTLLGDFNGDGVTDVLYVAGWGAPTQLFTVWLANGDGTFTSHLSNIGASIANSLQGAPIDLSRLKLGDFNGDGKTDILYIDGWGTSPNHPVYLSNGDGTFTVKASSGFASGISNSLSGAPIDIARILLGDFNGDGITDVLYVAGWGTPTQLFTVWFANGDGTFTSHLSNIGASIANSLQGAPIDLSRLKLGDFNGDGKTDILFIDGWGTSPNHPVYLSNGDGTFTTQASSGFASGISSDLSGAPIDIARILLGDFNGDGITDILYVAGWGVPTQLFTVWLANGDGTFTSHSSNIGTSIANSFQGASIDLSRLKLGDFNGDGKTDILYIDGWGTSPNHPIYLSNGDGTFTTQASSGFASGISNSLNGAPIDIARILLGDFNGDSKTDLLVLSAWGNTVNNPVYLQGNSEADRATGFVDQFGSTRTVTYTRSSAVQGASGASICVFPASCPNVSTVGIPNSSRRQLVTQVTQDDGLGLSTSVTSTIYAYSNGRTYPGSIGEVASTPGTPQTKDLGFQTITATESPTGLTTVTTYNQVQPYQGQPASVSRYAGSVNAANLLSQETYTYQDAASASATYAMFGSTPANASLVGGKDIHLVQAASKTTLGYEAGTQVHSATETYGYDTFGNVTSLQRCTDGDCTTLTTARTNLTTGTSWLIGRVDSTTVSQTATGNVLEYSALSYDSLNRVDLKDRLLCPDAENCTISGGALIPVEQGHTYDSFSNLTSVQDALGRTKTFTWDATGTFKLSESQTVSTPSSHTLTHQWTYDAFGHILTDIDANGATTTYAYDGLGRKISQTLPNGGTFSTTYNNWGNPQTQFVQTTRPDGASTLSYLDGLGREYRNVRSGDGGTSIYQTSTTSYAPNQKVVATTRPYFSGDPIRSLLQTFDLRGRLIQAQQLDGSSVISSTSYQYLPGPYSGTHQITVTDGNGHASQEVYNGYGNLVSKTDPLGGVTQYSYGAGRRLTSVTLPNGQAVATTYDSFGRKTSVTDPSTGAVTFTYDNVGNVLTKADALGRSTTYTYDELNRALTKVTAEGTVGFTYDDSSVHGQGRLTTVNELFGTTQLAYDVMGRMASKTLTFSGLTRTFTEGYSFDTLGRPSTVTYPDGSVAAYTYTVGGGNLSQVSLGGTTYATYSHYSADGRAGTKTLNSGVTTTYNYGPRGELTSLSTDGAGGNMQNLAYLFDPVGNVSSITDTHTSPVLNSILSNETQTFAYDPLDRLTQAVGVNSYGTKTYQYDAIGNLTQFGGVHDKHLSYTGQQAAASTDSDFTATYDAVGNLLAKTQDSASWNYTFDTDNRLTTVSGPSQLALDYDSRGERVRKNFTYGAGGVTTTYYIGRDYEIRNVAGTAGSYKQSIHLTAPGVGRIATITTELLGTIVSNDSAAYYAYAGMFDGGSGPGLAQKVKYLTLGVLHERGGARTVGLGFLGLTLAILLGGTIVVLIREGHQPVSRFSAEFRLAALTVTVVLLAASCDGVFRKGQDQVSTRIPVQSGPGQPPFYGHYPDLITLDPQNGPALGTWYYHSSHLGSAAVMTDATGQEATRFLYMPYGEIDQDHSNGDYTATSDFTSQERDPESGLMYYRARYYDPSIGRFLTADSIIPDVSDGQSFNRYAYVRDNPIINSDPSGHDCWGLCNGGVGLGGVQIGGSGCNGICAGGRSVVDSNTALAVVGLLAPGAGAALALATNASVNTALARLNSQFNQLAKEHPEILVAGALCGLECGMAAAWATGDRDLRNDDVDILATEADIGVSLLFGPYAGAAVSGFIQGYGHAVVNGADPLNGATIGAGLTGAAESVAITFAIGQIIPEGNPNTGGSVLGLDTYGTSTVVSIGKIIGGEIIGDAIQNNPRDVDRYMGIVSRNLRAWRDPRSSLPDPSVPQM